MLIHYLTHLFLFRIVLTEKYKKVQLIEDDFYRKIIESKCSRKFKLKAGYTAEEQRVWRFSVNKNYWIKDIISSKKEKRIACTKYFFFMFLKHARKWPHGGVLCKGYHQNTLTGIKTDKLFGSIFREIFQNIKPFFKFFFKFQEFFG